MDPRGLGYTKYNPQKLDKFTKRMFSCFTKKGHRSQPHTFPKKVILALIKRIYTAMVPCDKNISPSIIKQKNLIILPSDGHLNDETTFMELSEDIASLAMAMIHKKI